MTKKRSLNLQPPDFLSTINLVRFQVAKNFQAEIITIKQVETSQFFWLPITDNFTSHLKKTYIKRLSGECPNHLK